MNLTIHTYGLLIQYFLISFRSGHSERITSVLKLDVEGEEFKSLPQIFQSRVLRNIKQIHVEV